MRSYEINQDRIRLYLLGRLNDSERAELEQRLLTDESFYEEISISEDELTDEYVADELSPEDRRSFEEHFLAAPERQHAVHFGRALQRYIANTEDMRKLEQEQPLASPPTSTVKTRTRTGKFSLFSFLRGNSPVLNYSLVAALLLLVVAGSWVAINNRTPPTTGNILALQLTPGLTRGNGQIKKINIPPDIQTLRLQLQMTNREYESFRAILLSDERTEVFVGDGLRANSDPNALDFDVPSHLLKPGDYQVRLSARGNDGNYEDVNRYVFRITN